MAIFKLDDAFFSFEGTDLSDHVTSITLEVGGDTIDTTAMGSAGWANSMPGQKNWSLQVTLQQDFAAGKVDELIWQKLGQNAAIVVRPKKGSAVSATNPQFSGSVSVTEYTPLANGVNELATVDVTWDGAGALARATS